MGQHPRAAVWDASGGQNICALKRLTKEQCQFLDSNIGISRRTLRHVHVMFNDKFETDLNWERFMTLRADAISEGRCKTAYIKHYYKNENSSERELRLQRPVLKSRIIGGCQFQPVQDRPACGAPTLGRYCEKHVHAAYSNRQRSKRGLSYVDSSLGKYG